MTIDSSQSHLVKIEQGKKRCRTSKDDVTSTLSQSARSTNAHGSSSSQPVIIDIISDDDDHHQNNIMGDLDGFDHGDNIDNGSNDNDDGDLRVNSISSVPNKRMRVHAQPISVSMCQDFLRLDESDRLLLSSYRMDISHKLKSDKLASNWCSLPIGTSLSGRPMNIKKRACIYLATLDGGTKVFEPFALPKDILGDDTVEKEIESDESLASQMSSVMAHVNWRSELPQLLRGPKVVLILEAIKLDSHTVELKFFLSPDQLMTQDELAKDEEIDMHSPVKATKIARRQYKQARVFQFMICFN